MKFGLGALFYSFNWVRLRLRLTLRSGPMAATFQARRRPCHSFHTSHTLKLGTIGAGCISTSSPPQISSSPSSSSSSSASAKERSRTLIRGREFLGQAGKQPFLSSAPSLPPRPTHYRLCPRSTFRFWKGRRSPGFKVFHLLSRRAVLVAPRGGAMGSLSIDGRW